MKRREFLATMAVAASAWSADATAQAGKPAAGAPTIGFLNSASPGTYRFNADAFREGLA